jgi:alcohol dehydrogenase class IV
MLKAAYTAGRAINITQTTAGHAMCYKITSLFGCAHGHAAMLCNRVLFPWMLNNTDKCTDPRGTKHLESVFKEIATAMGCRTSREAADKLNHIFDELGLFVPEANAEQYDILRNSVNPVRLKNNPVPLDPESINELYHRILR